MSHGHAYSNFFRQPENKISRGRGRPPSKWPVMLRTPQQVSKSPAFPNLVHLVVIVHRGTQVNTLGTLIRQQVIKSPSSEVHSQQRGRPAPERSRNRTEAVSRFLQKSKIRAPRRRHPSQNKLSVASSGLSSELNLSLRAWTWSRDTVAGDRGSDVL